MQPIIHGYNVWIESVLAFYESLIDLDCKVLISSDVENYQLNWSRNMQVSTGSTHQILESIHSISVLFCLPYSVLTFPEVC